MLSGLTFIDGYGYHPDDAAELFIKVSLGDPKVYKKFAEIVPYKVYMAQVDHVCQFKIDVGLAHPNKLLVLGPDFEYDERTSRFVTSVHNLRTVDNVDKETPVLKAMSIDIKCISHSGSFSKAEKKDYNIIQIASVVTTDVLRATHDRDDFRKYAFVVGSCDSVDNTEVRHYDSESNMLKGFMSHVVSMDPDVITGYQGCSFHWPYILERFKLLKLKPSFSRRRYGGEWSLEVYDNKKVVSSYDRILVDMHDVITAEQKLRSYSLDCVVREFIPGEVQLEDVTYEQVKEFHEGTSTTRSRIAGCCVKRALMPLKLMIKFNTMMSILEISNITGVPMRYVYSRGDEFVPESVRKGILPTILVDLLSARKQVKEETAEFKHDPFTLSLLNERQLAIKKCANSVYGFTGAVRYGILPCIEIARSVTAYGRTLMDKTVYYVEKEYTKHEVIYGDTDSVMIIYRRKTVAKAMEMGKELAETISRKFPHPIRLEFEKVFKPYLLLGKKKYAGAVYSSNPNTHDKVEVKGIEMIRRDCLPYLARVMEACIHEMIVKENIPAAQEIAQRAKDDLLSGNVDIAELTLSKKYNNKKYKRAPTH
nr:DNA polymerase delta catalytic subunit-like [Dermacentor andersoni]